MNTRRRKRARLGCLVLPVLTVLAAAQARAEEHVVLTNGFEMDCLRHELQAETGRVRLYSSGQGAAYLEVEPAAIRAIETIEAPPGGQGKIAEADSATVTIPQLLGEAGARHHIDRDLLLSLVNAESGGRTTAVSRVGARGLMQLMPGTAAALGVRDALQPEQNIAGGTAYLDQLLSRFHDDVALALAAYNAGPGAVERWHGIPPYRETRAYVACILTEYNRRKRAALAVAVR